MVVEQGSLGRSSARYIVSLLDFDRSDFYLGDEGQIVAQIGITGVAGFDRRHFALTEQPEKIPQPPAGERDIVRGEKKLETILGRIGFLF